MKNSIELRELNFLKIPFLEIGFIVALASGMIILFYHFFFWTDLIVNPSFWRSSLLFERLPAVTRNFWFSYFWVFALILLLLRLIDFLNQTSLKIKFKEIIKLNSDMYVLNDKNEVETSMLVKFRKKKDSLEIWLYPRGLSVANRVDELGKILESKFELSVVEIDNSRPECCYYYLSNGLGDAGIDATREFL